MKILSIENLSISFGQNDKLVEAVKCLNLDLNQGEILGIVGESGSGKSVTAMSITRLLSSSAQYVSGRIQYFNEDKTIELLSIKENELQGIRGRAISIIFQEPMSSLNPLLTCGDQVAEGLLAHKLLPRNEVKDKVLFWFSKVGIQEPNRVYQSFPHQLSGGQLQRVLIALALCCKPKIVIADEPTTALDVGIQKKILDLLLELKKEFNLSIIFISHDLGVIQYLCDRVVVMRHGSKVEESETSEVFINPKQNYTKGLIYSRPSIKYKLRRLPTVTDFEKNPDYKNWKDDINLINSTEQDRKNIELCQAKILIDVNNLKIEFIQSRNWFGKITKKIVAIQQASFKIHEGEVLGLVGESGSGKSSLGKGILGLTQISSGSVIYKGIELTKLSNKEWRPLRKELQIVFQDPYSSLNPRKNIYSAITEPMIVHQIYSNEKERKEKAVDLLETVGLKSEHLQRYPHQFSGGQRQRICIARALALNPRFIVCDESVSALDVSVQAQVLNLLVELKSKFGLSLLFITHDLSVVNFIADRIIVLQNGTIKEEGYPYQIINNPKSEYTKSLINSLI
ncbi:MAG: ABC transporter ATP-binding protein [Saprospiraceae bacterium]|nr:ABC transporter ATP-binding protein [Saprospiraceae bacterium]